MSVNGDDGEMGLMNIDKLVKAVKESTCATHFYYNEHGNGVTCFKSQCPQCQIDKLTSELAAMTVERDELKEELKELESDCKEVMSDYQSLGKEHHELKTKLAFSEIDLVAANQHIYNLGECHTIDLRERDRAIKGYVKKLTTSNEMYDNSVQQTASRCAEIARAWQPDCIDGEPVWERISYAIRKEFKL